MPKSSKTKIEDDEKKVALALHKNARETVEVIGKKCGFSRQKVWRIIKRLEKQKNIWGYSAVIDDDFLDYRRFHLLVKRTPQYVSSNVLDIVYKRKLDTLAEEYAIDLEGSLFTHGEYDWVFIVTAPNIQQVKKFLEAFQQMFTGYVEHIDILEVLFPIKKNGVKNPKIKSLKNYFI